MFGALYDYRHDDRRDDKPIKENGGRATKHVLNESGVIKMGNYGWQFAAREVDK